MHRSLIWFSLVALLFCQTCTPWKKFNISLAQVSIDRLLESELQPASEKEQRFLEKNNSEEVPYHALALAYIHFRQKKYDESKNILQNLLTKPVFDLKEYAYFYLTKNALAEVFCSEALESMNQLKLLFPASPLNNDLLYEWENICIPKTELEPMTTKALIQRVKHDLYETALESFEMKDYQKAVSLFLNFLAKIDARDPKVEEVLMKLALIYKRTGKQEKYIHVLKNLSRLRKASKKFPYNPRWLFEIARYYWNQEKIYLTKKHLEQLIQWPYHRYVGRSYFILAKIEAEKRHFEKALEYLTKATEHMIQPEQEEEIAYLKGWYAYKFKKWDQTRDAFDAFLTTYPNSDYLIRVRYWKARAHLELNELEKAKEIFLTITQNDPYSYYGIRSQYRLDKSRPALHIEDHTIVSYSKKDLSKSIDENLLKKASLLIYFGCGTDGVELLKRALPLKTIFQMPSTLQYDAAILFGLGGDHLTSFIILNDLQKKNLQDLPPEHLKILYPKRYWELITKYAAPLDIDPYLLLAIMRQESAFDPTVISPADAYGLLQIVPAVARDMGKKIKFNLEFSDQLLDPEINIRLCSFYVSQLLKKYKNNLILALAAYNSNDRAVKKWLATYGPSVDATTDDEEFIEDIPYQETRNYVKFVLRNYTNSVYIYEGKFTVYPLPH